MRVCHVTSVHDSYDVRIFLKECSTLASNGYDTYLVAPGTSRKENGVNVIGVGQKPLSRIHRILFFSKSVIKKAINLDCDIYHIHDPELLLYYNLLIKKNKVLIFDSHEDVSVQIQNKRYIPFFIRKFISFIYSKYENFVLKRFNAIVASTDYIKDKFIRINKKTISLHNYPILKEFISKDNQLKKNNIVCYVGGISDLRGESIMIDAFKDINGQLIIAGKHNITKFNNVEYVGELSRREVVDLYSQSTLGLCLLKPVENYLYSKPIKMYEYMAAGIPFVCSNFPEWLKLVNETSAGICVNPLNRDEIIIAISKLLNNKELSNSMGQNGYNYVVKYCNWEKESLKLLDLYSSLL